MFFVIAIGSLVGYFFLGWSSNMIAQVSELRSFSKHSTLSRAKGKEKKRENNNEGPR